MQHFPTIHLAIPTRVAAPFDHPDWVFELKHDGFRAVAYIADGRCQLVSRKNNVYKSFGPLREALAGLRIQDAVVDGEIVCLDDEGRSQFYTLLRRRGQPVFYTFDLLFLNGEDLRSLPSAFVSINHPPQTFFTPNQSGHGLQAQDWGVFS